MPTRRPDARNPAASSRPLAAAAGSWAVALAAGAAPAWAGATERASVATGGAQAATPSFGPSISADGRYVAFGSAASKLVTGDTNGARDVFVRDRKAGTTARVSVGPGGRQAEGGDGFRSSAASISANGRYVAFSSDAANLVPGVPRKGGQVSVRDLMAKTTSLASLSSGGTPGNGFSSDPALSADGRLVASTSEAGNLVANDTNDVGDVFVHVR